MVMGIDPPPDAEQGETESRRGAVSSAHEFRPEKIGMHKRKRPLEISATNKIIIFCLDISKSGNQSN